MTDLEATSRICAILYAAQNTDVPFVHIFSRWEDGLDIPPSTYVEVIVRLVHEPDKQVTPILEMEEAIA